MRNNRLVKLAVCRLDTMSLLYISILGVPEGQLRNTRFWIFLPDTATNPFCLQQCQQHLFLLAWHYGMERKIWLPFTITIYYAVSYHSAVLNTTLWLVRWCRFLSSFRGSCSLTVCYSSSKQSFLHSSLVILSELMQIFTVTYRWLWRLLP